MRARVTVFVPVYNRAAYIVNAVESILAQSFCDFELLVIDDGSTDESASLVGNIRDPRLRLIRNEKNLGLPITRNKGLEFARGRYFALLDSDDYAFPERLAKQVAFLDRHQDHAVVGSWCGFMNESGRILRKRKRHPCNNEMIQAEMPFACRLSHRSFMGRTKVLRDFGYDKNFPVSEDYDLFSRISSAHKLANLPQVLVLGRVHADQTTAHTGRQGKQMRMVIMRRQLERLGIDVSVKDLERHYYLVRRGYPPLKRGRDYIDWAAHWLQYLHRANSEHLVYPEPEFAWALGLAWTAACWRGTTTNMFRWFSKPTLCRWAITGLKRRRSEFSEFEP